MENMTNKIAGWTILYDSGLDDIQQLDLELAGLDADELEYMDEDERREALEDAGLDPDDYDFDQTQGHRAIIDLAFQGLVR